MAFGKDYWKSVVEDTASRLGITATEVVDVLQDSLMKAHEGVGHVADTIANAALSAGVNVQDVLMDFSETLDDIIGLNEAKATFAEPGKVQDNPFTKYVNRNASNTVDWETSTREQKITAIIDFFGLRDTKEAREGYALYDDRQIDDILKIIKRYK